MAACVYCTAMIHDPKDYIDEAANLAVKRCMTSVMGYDSRTGNEVAETMAKLVREEITKRESNSEARVFDHWLTEIQENVAEWRDETLDGEPTLSTQASHTAVEAAEVLDILVKSETYSEDQSMDREHLIEECGDVMVAHLGTLTMMGVDAAEMLEKCEADDSRTELKAASSLLQKASSLAASVDDGAFSSNEVHQAGSVMEALLCLLMRLDTPLHEAVDAALEKNGAREWTEHQMEATR